MLFKRQAQIFFGFCALSFVLFTRQIFAGGAGEVKPASPQRIVSINLCTDALLLQLVGPERVAALTKFSADPEVSTVASQAQGIKKVQGGVEDVQGCGPDLLLGGRFSNKETLRFFGRSGIPVLTFGIPKNFEDIYADIRRLAEAVHEKEKGETIIRQMWEELAGLKKTSRSRRAVFFQSDNYVPGSGTFENAVMEAAGLRNVAAELGIRDYGRMGLEELIRAKPDVIILSGEQTKTRTVRGEVLSHPAIRKALPEAKIVTLPTLFLNCGSPASVEAVRILVKETHP
jgi:iron complex transport system substrate-binding protein